MPIGYMQPRGLMPSRNYGLKPYSGIPEMIPEIGGASPYIGAGLGALSLAAPLVAKSGRGGQTLSSLASGASTGAAIGSIIPGVGTAIGAGVGALIGGLSGALSESPEEQRKKRFDEFKKRLNEQRVKLGEQRQKALTEGSAKIGQLTSGLTKRFRSSAGKRAAALGRTSDVEAFELPVVEKVASAGSGAMSDFQLATNRQYDQYSQQLDQYGLDAEQQFLLGGELDPSAVDYLGEIAPQALQYMQNQEYMDLLSRYYGGGA